MEILVTMQEIASEINKMKRTPHLPLFTLWSLSLRVNCSPGNQLQKDARGWISPPDPSKNHIFARRIHFGESSVWFTEGRTFKEWDLTGGLLWIHGKRECLSNHRILCFSAADGNSRL
jgi:hypothetical protein